MVSERLLRLSPCQSYRERISESDQVATQHRRAEEGLEEPLGTVWIPKRHRGAKQSDSNRCHLASWGLTGWHLNCAITSWDLTALVSGKKKKSYGRKSPQEDWLKNISEFAVGKWSGGGGGLLPTFVWVPLWNETTCRPHFVPSSFCFVLKANGKQFTVYSKSLVEVFWLNAWL